MKGRRMDFTNVVGRGAAHWTRNPEIATLAANLFDGLGLGAEQSMPQAS